MAAWVSAQNSGDLAGYLAAYDAKSFVGLKRTHRRAKPKTLRFEAWKRDRSSMFNLTPAQAVEASGMKIESWLDLNTRLKPNVVRIEFTQRWRGGTYADHGTKALKLWRDAKGALLIVAEDMRNSQLGWDDAPAFDPEQIAAWKAPTTESDALALWLMLKPTGASYQTLLDAIPEQRAIRVPMALALVHSGKLDCNDIETTGQCGTEEQWWRDPAADAGFQDVCLRRRLLEWSVDVLAEARVFLTAEDYELLIDLPLPRNSDWRGPEPIAKEALPHRLLASLHSAPDELRVQVLTHAAKSYPEIVAKYISGMSDEALQKLYRALTLPEALLAMNEVNSRAFLLAAMKNEALPEETRRTVLNRIFADKARKLDQADQAALTELSGDKDCTLAVQADALLSAHKLPTYAQLHDERKTTASLMYALCKRAVQNDRELMRPFVVPMAKLKSTSQTTTQYECYEWAHSGEEPPKDAPPVELTGKQAFPPQLPSDNAGDYACVGLTCHVTVHPDENEECRSEFELTEGDGGFALEAVKESCKRVESHCCPC